jgi:hypothetical protein
MTSYKNVIKFAKSIANATGKSWWLIHFQYDGKLYRHIRPTPDLSNYPQSAVANEIKPEPKGAYHVAVHS